MVGAIVSADDLELYRAQSWPGAMRAVARQRTAILCARVADDRRNNGPVFSGVYRV